MLLYFCNLLEKKTEVCNLQMSNNAHVKYLLNFTVKF